MFSALVTETALPLTVVAAATPWRFTLAGVDESLTQDTSWPLAESAKSAICHGPVTIASPR